jgi:pilus assembly protein CpaB
VTNIRVLAVDQLANHDEAGASVVGRTATLEVEPRQVEILAAAESSGTISLSLRSAADNNDTPKALADDRTTGTVRIIRSGQVHSVRVRRTEPVEATQ